MPYTVDQLQPGDILVMQRRPGWHGARTLLDWAIAWSTSSPWVHACLVGHDVLIDPLWHVQTAALDTYADTGWVFTPAATPQQKERAIAWAMHRLGAPYGVRELLADGLRFDLHWTLWRWRPTRAVTCSGFLTLAYWQAGTVLTYAPFPAPSDLVASPVLRGARPTWGVLAMSDPTDHDQEGQP